MPDAKVLTVPLLSDLHKPSLEQLLKLLDVCRFMSLEKNLDKLLIYIADQARKALEADRCSIFLLDEARSEIWSKVQLGENQIIRFPRGAGAAGRAIELGQIIHIPDAYSSTLFNPEVDRATGYRTRNILCVPMANVEGKSIGCLQLLNKVQGDFKPADETFIIAFAAQAAVAIESAFLHQKNASMIVDLSSAETRLKQKVDQLEVIRELEQAVNESVTLYDFINVVIRRAIRAVGAEVGRLLIQVDSKNWETYTTTIEEGRKVSHAKREGLNSAYLSELMDDGKALILNNLQSSDLDTLELATELGTPLESLLAIPIQQAHDTHKPEGSRGVFEVYNKASGFLYEDLAFMQIIAAQIFSLILRKQLIDEKKRSENLAAIGQIASTIIHDLKNPISAIIGCSELLSGREQISEQQLDRLCTIIRNQASRCITMVEELLSVARGEKKFHFEIMPLNELLDEIKFMLESETERLKVELKTDFTYKGLVRIDKAKLMRVIFNLTNNALEILKLEGKITLESKALDAEWVEIVIADNGPGIPPEMAKNLFQPFATFGKSKGTGLGLYIAREIIHDHGGSIELDRSYKSGACFRIKLRQEF